MKEDNQIQHELKENRYLAIRYLNQKKKQNNKNYIKYTAKEIKKKTKNKRQRDKAQSRKKNTRPKSQSNK